MHWAACTTKSTVTSAVIIAVRDVRRRTYVVITPVRDEEEYLRLTIESMIAQSLLPTEMDHRQ